MNTNFMATVMAARSPSRSSSAPDGTGGAANPTCGSGVAGSTAASRVGVLLPPNIGVQHCRRPRAGSHSRLAAHRSRRLIVGCLIKAAHENNNGKPKADRDKGGIEGSAGVGCSSGDSVVRALSARKKSHQAHGDHLRVRESIRVAWRSNKQARQSLNCRVSRQAGKFSGLLPWIDVQPREDRDRVERRRAAIIRNGREQEGVVGQPKAGR